MSVYMLSEDVEITVIGKIDETSMESMIEHLSPRAMTLFIWLATKGVDRIENCMEGYELIPALIELIDREYLEWWDWEYERIVLHCDKELEYIDNLQKGE